MAAQWDPRSAQMFPWPAAQEFGARAALSASFMDSLIPGLVTAQAFPAKSLSCPGPSQAGLAQAPGGMAGTLCLSPLLTWAQSCLLLGGRGPSVKYRMATPGALRLVPGWEDKGAIGILLPVEHLLCVKLDTLPQGVAER